GTDGSTCPPCAGPASVIASMTSSAACRTLHFRKAADEWCCARLSDSTDNGTIGLAGRLMATGPEECRTMSQVKEAALELVQNLPEDCTWDEVMYKIFVRQKIDAGLKDADAGR